ncbi:hypothetical protein [Rhodobacter capsulatus]|uniref:hypothetical protein n=1 Tax=Rhodobacter capsulatus TaxID=1061 RepID=UPI0010392E16|nr:hypothetical protein [Rhodobacter capsulatus]
MENNQPFLDWFSKIFWTNLSEAQAVLLSSILTMLAALLGVLLANFFLSGKVKSVEDAIAALNESVQSRLKNLDDTLQQLQTKSDVLDQLISALSSRIAQISEAQNESASSAEILSEAVSDELDTNTGTISQPEIREQVKEIWHSARDIVESIASDPKIDGRTRASYMRVDRRSYESLIAKLYKDNHLTEEQAGAVRAIYTAWNRVRPNRSQQPLKVDLEELKSQAKKLERLREVNSLS